MLCFTPVNREHVKNHVPGAQGRAYVTSAITEKPLQQRYENLLRSNGYLVYHTLRSKGSAPGFPDIFAVLQNIDTDADVPWILMPEIKTAKGKLSWAQDAWLRSLGSAAALINMAVGKDVFVVDVWRPDDYNRVVRMVGGKEFLG